MDLNIHGVLRRIPLFHDLSEEALNAVAGRLIPRQVPENAILFRKGELCRGLYILVRGEVEIYRTTFEGREQVIHTETPVKTVAELPLFDGGPYPASARASQDSTLLFLSQDDFQRLYREHPEIADSVILNLGRRLRKLVGLVEKVSLRDVGSRVALALMEFAEQAGQRRPGGSFEVPRTQSQLAAELATSRESVARALAQFREAGLVEQKGRRVTIRDLGGVERTASGDAGMPGVR
jgi:CRP/FNR family transcriptional regulator